MNWEKLLRKRGFWISLVCVLFLISPFFLWKEFYWEDYFRGLSMWLWPSLMFYSVGLLVWIFYFMGLVPDPGDNFTFLRYADDFFFYMPFSILASIAGWIAFGVFLKNIKKVKRATLFKVLFFILLIAIIAMVGCTKIDYPS